MCTKYLIAPTQRMATQDHGHSTGYLCGRKVSSTLESTMSVKAGYSTPMLHAADIEKSIRFYELFGFTTIDTEGCAPLAWARLHCEDGSAAMFLRVSADGIKVPPINSPEYMPSGKINLADPDGYQIEIAHWRKSDQEAWEKHLKSKAGVAS